MPPASMGALSSVRASAGETDRDGAVRAGAAARVGAAGLLASGA